MPMQKPSRLLPDDSHHLMATDCVLPQVALWGKGMVCALKRTSGLNGWISNQKHISLQSVALREGSRGFEVYNSKFTETSYGVPITCSFSYANSHGLVETEFINTIHIEPLYVKPSRENNSYLPDYSNKSDYHSSSQLYLYFYKDREKTKPSQPYIDIIFNISMFENKCNYEPNYKNWPMINANCTDKTERIIMRNIDFKSKIYVGYNSSYYESTGSMPMEPNEPMRMWNATEYTREYSLLNSPFYQIIY